MSNSEILAVSKVLLESRAFTKKEIGAILDKMIAGCIPEKNRKLISDLLANEKYHYVELRHKKKLQNIIWDFGEDIRRLRRVEIVYEKMEKDTTGTKYVIEPVGLLFSEYYFYLNAYIVEKNDKGDWIHKYDYPAIFRLDRVKKRTDRKEQFRIAYSSRFEEGEFRKRIQFMYAGKLLNLKFRYYGMSVESVLDRLPTAKLVEQDDTGAVIEAEVYGTGIVMWLLSQGKNVEVIRPAFLREEMKKILLEILEYYG
jgi:predicted DNA-binding transcriptional regulator YafY